MTIQLKKYKHPFLFYVLATLIPWFFWFLAAWVSQNYEEAALITTILGLLGLLAPAVVAIIFIKQDNICWSDFKGRFFFNSSVSYKYLILCLSIIPISIIVAQLISLMFGYSISQFYPSGKTSFSAGLLPGWLMLFLAPFIEELAWHSYGTDCLRVRMNLLKTSLLFGLFWGIWHLPLSFIKDYYHSHVAVEGLIYSANFIFSIFPFVIIMNWLYYKTGRNIAITIVFHITAGCANEFFSTHPDSKIIQTLLLSIFSVYLIIKEKSFWLEK